MRSCSAGWAQATWAFIVAAVPLLKQAVGGEAGAVQSEQVAPQLCCALARLCVQSTQGGRAFAAHIFKECTLLPLLGHPPHSPRLPQGATDSHACLRCTLVRIHINDTLCWRDTCS